MSARLRALRDAYRPYYDPSTGEVGYAVEVGEDAMRLTLPRPSPGASAGELSMLQAELKSAPLRNAIDLDTVEHFE